MKQLLLAAATLELPTGDAPPKEFRLFAYGTFRLISRPGVEFKFDEASAKSCLARAETWGNDFHLDYEHASMESPTDGAPAACWFNLEMRADGLWAVNCRWTEKASAMVKAREYRYWSPVFNFTDDGHVVAFINGGLTNLPATQDMEALAASLRNKTNPEPPPMKTVLAALKLADNASEADALASVNKLQTASVALLSLTGKPTEAEALQVAATWKLDSDKAVELAKANLALEEKVKGAEVETLIAKGKAEGKIPPALETFCKELGAKDVKMLGTFLEKASFLPKQNTESRNEPSGLNDLALAIAKKMNHKPEELQKLALEHGIQLTK